MDEEFEKLAKSFQTKTIRNLLYVWYIVFHDHSTSPIAEKILERARQENPNLEPTFRSLVWSLRPEDVAEILKISRRQATEYVKFFRTIYKEVAGYVP